MKTFKQFLNEETVLIKRWSEVDVDEKAAINYLNANCKTGLDAIKSGGLLYRGIDGGEKFKDFMIIDPSTGERTSRDSNNLYQLLFDSSEAFANYPKRSKSLICSTSLADALPYGHLYVVFPKDGAEIAVSSRSDLFSQLLTAPIFGASALSVLRLSKLLGYFLKILNIHADIKDEHGGPSKYVSANNIDSKLSKFDPYTLTLKLNFALEQVTYDEIFTHEEIRDAGTIVADQVYRLQTPDNLKLGDEAIKFFKKNGFKQIAARKFFALMEDNKDSRFSAIASLVFTPSRVGVSLETYGSSNLARLGSVNSSGSEVWLSSQAMLIGAPMFTKILRKLKETNFPIDKEVEKWFIYTQK